MRCLFNGTLRVKKVYEIILTKDKFRMTNDNNKHFLLTDIRTNDKKRITNFPSS
jgi:hypothetical protein